MDQTTWNPDLYERFKVFRFQAFYDLEKKITTEKPGSVIDIGCGSGQLTRFLHDKRESAFTIGVDASAEMLAKGKEYEDDTFILEQLDCNSLCSGGYFVNEWTNPPFKADCKDYLDRSYDLVVSNACLQWLPNHELVMRKMCQLVKPGGELAIQIPYNHVHYQQTILNKIMAESPYKEISEGYQYRSHCLLPERYAEILYEEGIEDAEITMKYYSMAATASDIATFSQSTVCQRFLQYLSGEKQKDFMAEYEKRLEERKTGELFTFARLFMVGRRSSDAPKAQDDDNDQ